MDVAFTMWRMPDDSTRTVKVRQSEYHEFAIVHGAVGDAPGRPSPDAVFLMAAGGCDDVDDYPWEHRSGQASEPKDGLSLLTEHIADPKGTRRIQRLIPNHRSVTFDAHSSGSATNASSLTISHTVASQSNLYIAGMVKFTADTLSAASYNGVSMTSRDSSVGAGSALYYTDLINPATGTHNLVFTPAGAKADITGGGVSAYGVDQTTPRRSTANNTSTSANPTISLTSATGDLGISLIGFDGAVGGTDTIDATWTFDWNVSAGAQLSAGAHAPGATGLTRTDTAQFSVGWRAVGASIQPAATTATTPHLLPLLGVGN